MNNDTLKVLPSFLDSICIDNYIFICSDYHHTISLRKEIIDRTVNGENLRKIVSSSNPHYKEKCERNIKHNVPFSNYSLIDLCIYRLEELKQVELIKQNDIKL